MGIWYDQYLKKRKISLEIVVLGCWGEVAHMCPLRLRHNTYLVLGVTRAHMGESLLKLSITDLNAYCIFVKSVYYKVLIFCLCGSFGGNIVFILNTLRYNYNTSK